MASDIPRQINIVTPDTSQIPQSASHAVTETSEVELKTVSRQRLDKIAGNVLDLVDFALEPPQGVSRI